MKKTNNRNYKNKKKEIPLRVSMKKITMRIQT